MKLINGEVEGLKHVQKITDSFIKYPKERKKGAVLLLVLILER